LKDTSRASLDTAGRLPTQSSYLFPLPLLPLLLLLNRSMVTPLCAKLSSQDPAVAAAARSEAVAAALATSRSGLPKQLHTIIPVLLARLTAVLVQELKPAEDALRCWTPDDAAQNVQVCPVMVLSCTASCF
jgi:hypothetical protein